MQHASYLSLVVMTFLVAMVTAFDGIALVSIRRTRRTPASSRFMSLGLITFDCLFMWGLLIRLWCDQEWWVVFVSRVCFILGNFALNTCAMMTYERYIVLVHGKRLYTHMNTKLGKRIICVVWTALFIVYTGRLIVCSLIFEEVASSTGRCFTLSGQIVGGFGTSMFLVSVICCFRIYAILSTKRKKHNNVLQKMNIPAKRRKMRQVSFKNVASIVSSLNIEEKCSYLVFTYMLTIMIGIIAQLAYVITSTNGQKPTFYVVGVALTLVLCVANPCLYGFWFRECRMELFKMIVCCAPSLQTTIETMRIEIYDIVTKSTKTKPRPTRDVQTDKTGSDTRVGTPVTQKR